MRIIIPELLLAATALTAVEHPMPITCLEVVTLRLASGADRAAFITGAQAVDRLLAVTPGNLGRCLAEAPDGSWIDVVGWRDRAAAEAAAATLPAAQAAQVWFANMDPDSITMRHLDVRADHWPVGTHLVWSATGAGNISGSDGAGALVLRWLDHPAPNAALVVLSRP